MIYRLSSNQQKELMLKARPMNIVVPAPITDPPNLLQWARYVFVANDFGKYIVGVDRRQIVVTPSGSDDSFAGVVGRIVQDPETCECPLMWRVDVVLCRFHPPTPARLTESTIQWPKAALHDGKRWPSPADPVRFGEKCDDGLNEFAQTLVDGQ